jgi:hypothetical protein
MQHVLKIWGLGLHVIQVLTLQLISGAKLAWSNRGETQLLTLRRTGMGDAEE